MESDTGKTAHTQLYYRALNKSLRRFGESLKASKEYTAQGRAIVDKIGRTLHKAVEVNEAGILGFSVDERFFTSSAARKTDVFSPDFDITLFISSTSGEDPPFPSALAWFHSVLLEKSQELEILLGSVAKNSRGITFQLQNGIEVELRTGSDEQLELIYAKMVKEHSSSLGKDAATFLKAQSSIAHTIARLGKVWYRSVHIPARILGGTTIVELICVAAALKQEGKGGANVLNGFLTAMEMLEGLSSVKLVFRKIPGRKKKNSRWCIIPSEILEEMEPLVKFGAETVDISETLKKSCFLINPVNVFNDLLSGLDKEAVRQLMTAASVTKERLIALMEANTGIDETKGVHIQFEKLFEPQVTNFGNPVGYFLTFAPYRDGPDSFTRVPSIEGRKEDMSQEELTEVYRVMNAMKNCLLIIANSVSRGDLSSEIDNSVLTAVEEMIEYTFKGELFAKRGTHPHEEHDVTIRVPYKIDTTDYAVILSMTWETNSFVSA